MALVKYTTNFADVRLFNTTIASWVMANGDTGNAWASSDFADKTVHIFGDFTGGGSVKLQGSNDPRVIADLANGTTTAVWVDLTDVSGSALSASATGYMKVIRENPYFIRPVITGTIVALNINITGKRVK